MKGVFPFELRLRSYRRKIEFGLVEEHSQVRPVARRFAGAVEIFWRFQPVDVKFRSRGSLCQKLKIIGGLNRENKRLEFSALVFTINGGLMNIMSNRSSRIRI